MTILSQVGEALHYAHDQNIVHRDLKPGNILFNAKGEALLADFGIAIVLETAGRTTEADASGTLAYMAPEQFKKIISKKSDQYALVQRITSSFRALRFSIGLRPRIVYEHICGILYLGCIAYELFTGQRPFAAFDEKSQIPPRQLNPQLPVHIEQAILTAMAKERTERYTDVATFIKALHTPPKTKEQWLDEGHTHYDAKRYDEALDAYERAILLDPSFARAYNGKGNALYYFKRYEEALAAFERAILLDPDCAPAYNGKGNALYYFKRYEEALAAYERAILLDPDCAPAYNGKGNALYYFKRYEEALAAYERAILLDPTDALAYNGKGNALYYFKRYEEALAAYERAILLDPTDALAYNGKGNALYYFKRYEEALAAYERAILLDPDYAPAYNGKGNALFSLRLYQEALAAYNSAIQLDPNYARAYNSKGNTLTRLRRSKEAQQAYAKARQLGYGWMRRSWGGFLVEKALAKKPEERYATAGALLQDFNAAMRTMGPDDPAAARPWYKLGKRDILAVVLAAVLYLVIAGPAVAFLSSPFGDVAGFVLWILPFVMGILAVVSSGRKGFDGLVPALISGFAGGCVFLFIASHLLGAVPIGFVLLDLAIYASLSLLGATIYVGIKKLWVRFRQKRSEQAEGPSNQIQIR